MDARASTAMDAGLGAACTLSVHGEFDMGTARSSTWLQPCDTHRYVHVNLAAAAFIDAAGLHGLVGAARRGATPRSHAPGSPDVAAARRSDRCWRRARALTPSALGAPVRHVHTVLCGSAPPAGTLSPHHEPVHLYRSGLGGA